ncbi:MAG: hypothetical protein ACE5GH_03835 [Fidelibacterota bacterium]
MNRVATPLIFVIATSLSAQFNYSASAGLGLPFPSPDFDQFNATISDSGLDKIASLWLPLAFDFSVKVYPSLRVGYFRLSSSLIKNRSSDDWALAITMSGISVQTYFTFLKRFEARFGFAPMLAKADFSQGKRKAETSPFRLSSSTKAGIQHRSFAYYSWMGVRFHLTTFLALEATLGHLKATFKGNKWKSEGKETDLTGKIDLTRPLFRFGVVLGW